MSTRKDGPVLIDLEGKDVAEPAAAPPVPDLSAPTPSGQAMQTMAALAARKPSKLARWFWSALVALVGFIASVLAYDFVMGLLERNPILGLTALILLGIFCLILLAIAIREMAAFGRLKKLDQIHADAQEAVASNDLEAARRVTADILALYKSRPETDWGRSRVVERQGDLFDADGMFGLIETDLLDPLDNAARREVEAAARQVATVTAIVPIALADLITALTSNLRMIRRIAEIYGGRSGTLGNWRLTRSVLTHLVATGAVAVGDDLIGSVAGGGVLAKVSRRFGEGIVNGALTARVGVAAMEVCRPLPFRAVRRPSVNNLVKRALTGLFGNADKEG